MPVLLCWYEVTWNEPGRCGAVSRHLDPRKAIDAAIEASIRHGSCGFFRMPVGRCLGEFEGGSPTHVYDDLSGLAGFAEKFGRQ